MTDLSIYIPHYRKPRQHLQSAITSVLCDMPPQSTLTVVANGAEAVANVRTLSDLPVLRVISSDHGLGLAGSWNACLDDAVGDLVHILHDDDAVDQGFYAAVLAMHHRYPDAALYMTGRRRFEDTPDRTSGVAVVSREYIRCTGEAAAGVLLEDNLHACGSVVINRRYIESLGGFRDTYPFCPDEEAYLRYAASGGIALTRAPLYRSRQHAGQTSLATWRKREFVASYVAARLDGASYFSHGLRRTAVQSSASRVISVAVTLVEHGDYAAARVTLQELQRSIPEVRGWPAYRLARLATRSRLIACAASLRRRWLARRHYDPPTR